MMLCLQWSLYIILHTQIESSVSNFQHICGHLAIDTPQSSIDDLALRYYHFIRFSFKSENGRKLNNVLI